MRPYPQEFFEPMMPRTEGPDWSRRRGTFDAPAPRAPDPEETPTPLDDADLEIEEEITRVDVRRTRSTDPTSSTGG